MDFFGSHPDLWVLDAMDGYGDAQAGYPARRPRNPDYMAGYAVAQKELAAVPRITEGA